MKPRRIILIVTVGLALATSGMAAKVKAARKPAESDLASIEARHLSVELAQTIAKQQAPAAVPDPLPQPFNPQGFNRLSRPEPARGAQTGPAKASADREILAAIASRITPTGTFSLGGERRLQFSKKRLKVGDHLTVTHDGQDYTLELTAIDATNFTLRLNREEITRPIKPGKNP